MKNDRLSWVENSKGIGICLVVYGHILLGLINSGAKNINQFFFPLSFNLVYSFHMPLFMALSGLFFKSSINKRGASLFVIEKIKTLIYPFIIWSIIQVSIEVMLSRYTNNHATMSKLLVCLVVPKGQFWFLIGLFLYSFINAFLYHFLNKYWLAISLILSILIFEIPIHSKEDSYERIMKHFIYFNFGIILSWCLSKPFFIKILKPSVIISMFLIFSSIEILYLFTDKTQLIFSLFLPQITGVILLIQLSMVFDKFHFDIFKFIGRYSFQIYLVHIILTSGLRIILSKFIHTNSVFLHITLGMLVGILGPILIFKFVNHKKPLSWLFKYPTFKSKSVRYAS